MKKKLLIVELNECDFNFFFYGAKKYNFPKIKEFFLNRKKLDTYTKDKHEGFNLDPWVQWVTVHTGKKSEEHKVYRLGQSLNKSKKQIWESLSKKKVNSTVWGAFNSTLNKTKYIDLFFPDPWSFNEKAFPENLNSFLKLPRYYAKNYPSTNIFKILFYGIIFFYNFFFSKTIFSIIKLFPEILKVFFISKLKSCNLYFFLDLISLLILKNKLKEKKSKLAIIALNSFAHYQHNYWDSKKYEYIYFWYLDKILKIIKNIENNYNSSIIYNGFSQKKIKNEFHLRFLKLEFLFKKLNLFFHSIEPNMTTGAIVKFKTFKHKIEAIKQIKNIRLYSYPLFEIFDFKKKKKFFYKFAIISKKNYYNKHSLKKNNYKKYFKKPKKIFKQNDINNHQLILIDHIFKNSVFLKSTSRHISKGILFYKNFKFFKNDIVKNKIDNFKIHDNILNYFK